MCPDTQDHMENIKEDINSLINNSVLPSLGVHGACGCGGPGWRRAAYLSMSDPTQTCPPAWWLITTPRRSCARPPTARGGSCDSTMFPTQGIQYSQVCGRIIGYQYGQVQAFIDSTYPIESIDCRYVDGVSLTYGNPQQHIWTFVSAWDESQHSFNSKCPCGIVIVSLLVTMQLTSFLPSLVMTTSVKLEHHKEKYLAVALLSPSTLMIPCGMVKVNSN